LGVRIADDLLRGLLSKGPLIVDSPIIRLRRLAIRLATEGDADGIWFASALAVYEAGAADGLSLDAALRLVPSPGCRSWWSAEQRDRRDILIREIRDRFFPGLPNSHTASQIDEKLRRYETTSWRFDRARRSPPAAYAGKLEVFLFAVLKLGQPISKRVIERALGACQELPPVSGDQAVRSLAEQEIEDAFEEEARLKPTS
jgi:hypothetical protein